MANPIPPSWDSPSPWTLDAWTDVHTIDSPSTIYWVEIVNKVSEGGVSSHINQPSAAEMWFYTNYETLTDDSSLQTLHLTILGGYYNGQMYTPFACPYNDNLYATSLDIKPSILDNTSTNSTGLPANYRTGVCRVSFQSLPYDVEGGDDSVSGYNTNWTTFQHSSTQDAFTSPVGTYIYKSSSPVPSTLQGKTANLGSLYTSSLGYIIMTLFRIPSTWALSTQGVSAAQYAQGNINNDVSFLGTDKGQLFLYSIDDGEPYGDWQGNNLYDIKLTFIYNPNYWNTSLAPDGKWYPVVTASGGNPPLTSISFASMIEAIIPPQA